MLSGDEFYGDEITSPLIRPEAKPSDNVRFSAWLARLDKIVQKEVGCSLDDLEDFDTRSAFDDDITPRAFFDEEIEPNL